MSDGSVFYDAEGLFEAYSLNEMPKDAFTATVGYMILNPVPRSIYQQIPTLGSNDKGISLDYKMSLTYSALDILNGYNVPILKNYAWYPNDHVDLNCCATRAAELLGYTHTFTERAADPYKLGVLEQEVEKMLLLTWTKDIGIIRLSESYGEHTKYSDVAKTISSWLLGLEADVARPKIIFIWYANHIAFAVENKFLEVQMDLFARLSIKYQPSLRNTFNVLESKYPPNSGRPGGKIFITSSMLLKCASENALIAELARALAAADNDWENVAATAVMLLPYLEQAGRDIAIFLLNNTSIFNLKFSDYVKTCKEIHANVRLTQQLPGYHKKWPEAHKGRAWANNIYGIDIIGGRSELLKFDTEGEFVMRTIDPAIRGILTITESKPNQLKYITGPQYDSYLLSVIFRVTRKLIRPMVKLETMERWFNRRMFWAPSGGAPGAKLDWLTTGDTERASLQQNRTPDESYRLNKRGALLSLSLNDLKNTLSNRLRRAVQWSVEALKYESAKLRGILNTGIYPFLAQAYWLSQFDTNVADNVWYSTAHGNTTRLANSLRRLSDLTRTALMWDYADFNINHTIKQMQLLYYASVSVLLERSETLTSQGLVKQIWNDMLDALKFSMDAKGAAYLHSALAKLTVLAARSLQSGERATSYVNSMSNEVDTEIVKDTARRVLGMEVFTGANDKLGDDLFGTCSTMWEAVLTSALYNLTGSAGQVYKLTMEYGGDISSYGEYLRLSYDGQNNTVTGYAPRAMMGFIHGEYMLDSVVTPYERTATILEQLNKLKRRGWCPPDHLVDSIIARNTSLVYTDRDGHKHHVTGDKKLAITPAIFGGIGVTQTQDVEIVSAGAGGLIRPVNAKPVALIIPSGEGKTYTAMRYSFAIDHDSLVDETIARPLREHANLTGDWKPVNKYLRHVADEFLVHAHTPKMLLTWSRDTAPIGIRCFAAVLELPTGIRANIANRASVQREFGKNAARFKSTQGISEYAAKLYLQYMSTNTYSVDVFESTSQLPQYKLPKLPATAILRKAKTHVIDYDTLNRYGIRQVSSIDDALLESAVSGAVPKRLLSQALADYAKALDGWQKAGHYTEKIIHVSGLNRLTQPIRAYIECVIHDNLALTDATGYVQTSSKFRLNSHNFPDTHEITHYYGFLTSLLNTFNLSTNAGLNLLLDEMAPLRYSGRIGKLYRLYKLQRPNAVETRHNYRQFNRLESFFEYAQQFSEKNRLLAYATFSANFDKYIDSSLSLIPPLNDDTSVEFVSFCRSATLRYFESDSERFFDLLTRQPSELTVTFWVVEQHLSQVIRQELGKRFPGIILKD
uniref:RNA-directed RNA polymerase n=1 Tax=Rosellinia necatrix fusagravirus 1 TaxID=2056542 RepID=A0A3G8GGF4_9VIRU|nr:replicase [Rosellinia necatrix fusagravirus 1]